MTKPTPPGRMPPPSADVGSAGAAAGGQPGGAGSPPSGAARRRGRAGARAAPAWRGAFFAFALLAIVAGAAWALLGSKVLLVRSVRVVGANALVTRSQVLAAAGVPAGLPMLRVSSAAVAHRVEERIRQVQSAQVSRDWPDTVVITVQPRRPLFAVGRPGHYQLVDAFGVAVRTVRSREGLPVLTAGAAALDGNPAVRAASEVLRELPGSIARQVRSVSALTEQDVSVRLADGVVIIWGDTARSSQKARELEVLMRRHARVYDVSAPGTAVTRG